MGPDNRVTTWAGFRDRWDGVINLMLGGECTAPLAFDFPAIEEIADEMRRDPGTGIASGAKDRTLRTDDIKAEFQALPIDQALSRPFSMAHYRLSAFDKPGGFLYGFRESVLDPWKAALNAAGFSFDRCYPIIFLGGPNYATNYHMDFSHVLAWQVYGTKNFCGLKEPGRWAPRETRVTYTEGHLVKPKAVADDDALCNLMTPGDVLWNMFLTPHWIEASTTPAMSVNISHGGLRLAGRLCEHERELDDFRLAAPDVAPARFAGGY